MSDDAMLQQSIKELTEAGAALSEWAETGSLNANEGEGLADRVQAAADRVHARAEELVRKARGQA